MVWDVDLKRRLVHEATRFELDVRFTSAARRVVLFGPSGAGKTQTLRMIAGISRPDTGRVAVGDRVLHDSATRTALSPQQRRLGCVFQDYALFPHLTVRQNIAFARRGGWRNPPPADDDAVVQRWIRSFQLDAVGALYPHQLSGGQRQRVALARALAREPAALLLDEPFAALDRPLRARLRDELSDLQAQVALPMLLVTHDEDDVAVLADAAVEMQAGRVIAPVAAR